MADLDVGTLVARIRIEGLREFIRDQERAEETFRGLGRAADRSQDQTSQAFQGTSRDAQQYEQRMRGVRQGEERSAQQAATAVRRSQGQMSTAFEQTARDARSSAQQAGTVFERQFDGAAGHAREAGGSGGSGFMAGFGSKVSMLGSKVGPIGAALAGVGAIGLVAGGVLVSAIRDGMEQQQTLANVQGNLGVDNATMARIGKAAGEAYAANFGESRDANLQSATAGFDFGLIGVKSTSAEMQNLIEKSATLNQMLGTETPETLRAVSGLVRSGLVANVDEAFDVIAASRTKGLNAQGDLVDSISEYSTGWKNSGLSAKTTMALISQSMALGVDNTDRGADAIREFGRRVTEEGPTIVSAINDIGLNGEAMYDAFKRGGPDAEKAFDQTFDKIRGIEDPVKRNAAAMALLGDTSGDFIGAFAQWDPSKAVSDFGQVDGAAQKAADTIGGTALSAIESAKRGIVQSANDMKLALADAFGPQIQGAVTWLTEHKGEVTGFFADAGAAGMTFLIDTGHVASAALRIWATFGGTIATVIGGFVENMGAATGVIGNLISKIPGMQGVGEGIKSAGDMAKALGAGLQNSADGARSAADFIDGKLIPGLEGAKRGFKDMGDNARESADKVEHAKTVADTLNQTINALPDNKPVNVSTPGGENAIGLLRDMGVKVTSDNFKNIVVQSPLAPNVIETLRQLNLKVVTDNGKTILVTDNGTAKATGDLIDQFVNKKRTAFVDVYPGLVKGNLPQSTDLGGGNATMPLDLLNGSKVQRASGGRVGGNGGPRADDQLILASSPEWIIQSKAAEHYGPAAMNAVNQGTAHIMTYANGGQVGQPAAYGLPAGSTGGFPSWVTELGAQYGVKPSTYAGHQESNRTEAGYAPNPQGLNRGIDWGGSTAQMQTFAEAMYARAQSDPAIEQIIWMNPQTGQKIGWHGRSPDTDGSYFASDYAGHTDHVHLRLAAQLGAGTAAGSAGTPGPRTIPLVKNPDGTYTSSDPAWAALLKRESGGDMKVVQKITDANSGGNEASGGFQIAKQTWAANGGLEFAPTAGEADPEKQAIVAARIFDKSGGSPWGAGLAGRENEAGLRAGITTATVPGSDATASGAAASGVQNVFVTGGRLDGATSNTDAPTTPSAPSKTTPDTTKVTGIGPLPLRAYAQGGFGGAPDKATMLNSARSWMTLAGEAGPEAYIPINKDPRSLALWMETGKRLGAVKAYAQGGFGGYTKDTTDAMKPKNAYDWLALGVGGAFAAESLIEPYIGMATGKQITLGDLSPTANTGANSSGAAEGALNEFGSAALQQLQEIAKLLKEGKELHVTVNSRPETGPAAMLLGSKGM